MSKQSKKQGNTTTSEFPLTENSKSERIGLRPTKETRKDFDIDLAFGKLHEDKILDMLENKKIEVKTERDVWTRSGNIAIEFESYGKPSGIAATKADYWFHNLSVGSQVFCTLVFDVKVLKQVIKNLDYEKIVNGGDNYASKMYLINLSKLFAKDTLKLYKNLVPKIGEKNGKSTTD